MFFSNLLTPVSLCDLNTSRTWVLSITRGMLFLKIEHADLVGGIPALGGEELELDDL